MLLALVHFIEVVIYLMRFTRMYWWPMFHRKLLPP